MGDVGDLIFSIVSGVDSLKGLPRFCLRCFSAGSFCSLIRMDDLLGSLLDVLALDCFLLLESESDSVAVEVIDSLE